MRYVYVIAAVAPDGVVHRYVGQSGKLRVRLALHRALHEREKHRNIPRDFIIDWDAIQIEGPFEGTAEEIAKGEEQRLYEFWRSQGPMLNKIAPKYTTADALLAASANIDGRKNMVQARAAITPERAAAGRQKSGKISGERNRLSGHMSAIGRQYGAIQGRKNIESGHLDRARALITPEQLSANGKRNGKIAGRIAVESGRLASYNMNRTSEERAALAGNAGKVGSKLVNARRWGVEIEIGLWVSRKTGAVLLDQRSTVTT